MTSFTTRVELHDASYQDYERLHTAMHAEGFTRTITSDKGVKYWLPTAEYYRTASLTRSQILDSAKRAAGTTNKSFAVVVVEANGVTWGRLEEGLSSDAWYNES